MVLPMTTTEREILGTLLALDEMVRRLPASDPKPDLLPVFSRLDQLAGELPPEADPELVHYLNKKSYEKARLWLQGRDDQNARGNCRH